MRLEIEIDGSTAVHLLALQARTLQVTGATDSEVNALEQLFKQICFALDRQQPVARQALAATLEVIA